MSKSYKRHAIIRQEKENHNYLNRQIRRDKYAEFLTPGAYKRHRPHWNDWHYRWTKEDAIKEWNEHRYASSRFSSLDEWLNYWASCTIRK